MGASNSFISEYEYKGENPLDVQEPFASVSKFKRNIIPQLLSFLEALKNDTVVSTRKLTYKNKQAIYLVETIDSITSLLEKNDVTIKDAYLKQQALQVVKLSSIHVMSFVNNIVSDFTDAIASMAVESNYRDIEYKWQRLPQNRYKYKDDVPNDVADYTETVGHILQDIYTVKTIQDQESLLRKIILRHIPGTETSLMNASNDIILKLLRASQMLMNIGPTFTRLAVKYSMAYDESKFNGQEFLVALRTGQDKNPLFTYIKSLPTVCPVRFDLEWDAKLKTLTETTKDSIPCEPYEFAVFMLRMASKNAKAHANSLILDLKQKCIYHFEPNGSCSLYSVSDGAEDLWEDELLRKKLTEKYAMLGFKYIPVHEGLKKGPQECEKDDEYYAMGLNDAKGYCAFWSLFFIEMAIEFRKDVYGLNFVADINLVIETILYLWPNIHVLIRWYASYVNSKVQEPVVQDMSLDKKLAISEAKVQELRVENKKYKDNLNTQMERLRIKNGICTTLKERVRQYAKTYDDAKTDLNAALVLKNMNIEFMTSYLKNNYNDMLCVMPDAIFVEYPLTTWAPSSLQTQISDCQQNFVVIFVSILIVDENVRHRNMIFIDKKKRTAELFEPHGSTSKFVLSESMTKYFKQINIVYIDAKQSCPTYGPQYIESNHTIITDNDSIDPGGYCSFWALFMVECRLIFPGVDVDTITKSLVHCFCDLRPVIRYYAAHIKKTMELTSFKSSQSVWESFNKHRYKFYEI